MSQAATDTLARKSADTSILSGSPLVAKAQKNEGVDTIFTLCGGHFFDIYDGGLHEKIRIPFGKFADPLGGYGEEGSDPNEIRPALQRAHESVSSIGRSAVVNIWVDPDAYAPGTKAQTKYN